MSVRLGPKSAEQLKLTPEVFMKAFMRCEKREKPFKKKDGIKIEQEEDFYNAGSTMNDSIIAESIIESCQHYDAKTDMLIFCSDNIKDFATYDKGEDKYSLHSDIKKNIKLQVIYYRSLPDMLEKEFKEAISAESKQGIENAKNQYTWISFAEAFADTLKRSVDTQNTWAEIFKEQPKVTWAEIFKEQPKVTWAEIFKEQRKSALTKILKEQSILDDLLKEQSIGSLADALREICGPSKNKSLSDTISTEDKVDKEDEHKDDDGDDGISDAEGK